MIERACGVKGGQPKQAVGQHLMNLLGGMKHARSRGDAQVQPGESVVESASVPDIGDKSKNRDEDHQRIQKMVRRKRNAAIEVADVGR